MKWISVKDSLPKEYKYYLVCSLKECSKCDMDEEHTHRLNFKRIRFDVAMWAQADLFLVSYYRSLNDHSWDDYAVDHWGESALEDKQITHWMEFPQHPNRYEDWHDKCEKCKLEK